MKALALSVLFFATLANAGTENYFPQPDGTIEAIRAEYDKASEISQLSSLTKNFINAQKSKFASENTTLKKVVRLETLT